MERKPRTTGSSPWLWGTTLAGSPEHSPREIAVGGVHKVLTETIISQGESPRLRTGRSVVRGKQGGGLCEALCDGMSTSNGQTVKTCMLAGVPL